MSKLLEVSWGSLTTGTGSGKDLPALLEQLTSVDGLDFAETQSQAWEQLGDKGELFDALPPFVECLLSELESPSSQLPLVRQAQLLSLVGELFTQGTGDKVATGFDLRAPANERYATAVGLALQQTLTKRLAWFESLLAHDSAPLRAAGLKLLVFCTPASEHLLKLVASLAEQDPDDVVRGLALQCLGVILRQVPSPHAAATLRATLVNKSALPLHRLCALTATLCVEPSSSDRLPLDLIREGMLLPNLEGDRFPLKGGSLAELIYECVCEATQGVEVMRRVFLELALDERLTIEARRNWFEEIFHKTLPKPALGYALREDFEARDFDFLCELSQKDYVQLLHYPPIYSNPFHWIGVPAGLRARRRWLELEPGGLMTQRLQAVTQGVRATWTVWRHLLECVDKDGDLVPKLLLEFTKKHLGPLAPLELLCDDLGSNPYDERMIWGVQEFAMAPAESLANKASPEVVQWATQRIHELEQLEGGKLKSFMSSCDAALVLAPLAKSLRKGSYLPSKWAQLMSWMSRHPKLAKHVWKAFDAETKASYLSLRLAPWIDEPSRFFDPAKGFARLFMQFEDALEFFTEPTSLAVLGRFCATALESDPDAARYYLIPSKVPQFLRLQAEANPHAAHALEPYAAVLNELGHAEPGDWLYYYYQARGTQHVDSSSFEALDEVAKQQLEIFARQVYGLESAQQVLNYWREPSNRRLCYRTKVGLFTGATFYDLWLTVENSRRRETCVFPQGELTPLPITLAREDFVSTDGKPQSIALAQACEEALLTAAPNDRRNVSWRTYWGLDESPPNILPSPAPGIPGAIRVTQRTASTNIDNSKPAPTEVPHKVNSTTKKRTTSRQVTTNEKAVSRTTASKKVTKKASSKASPAAKKAKAKAPSASKKVSKKAASKASPAAKKAKAKAPSTSKKATKTASKRKPSNGHR